MTTPSTALTVTAANSAPVIAPVRFSTADEAAITGTSTAPSTMITEPASNAPGPPLALDTSANTAQHASESVPSASSSTRLTFADNVYADVHELGPEPDVPLQMYFLREAIEEYRLKAAQFEEELEFPKGTEYIDLAQQLIVQPPTVSDASAWLPAAMTTAVRPGAAETVKRAPDKGWATALSTRPATISAVTAIGFGPSPVAPDCVPHNSPPRRAEPGTNRDTGNVKMPQASDPAGEGARPTDTAGAILQNRPTADDSPFNIFTETSQNECDEAEPARKRQRMEFELQRSPAPTPLDRQALQAGSDGQGTDSQADMRTWLQQHQQRTIQVVPYEVIDSLRDSGDGTGHPYLHVPAGIFGRTHLKDSEPIIDLNLAQPIEGGLQAEGLRLESITLDQPLPAYRYAQLLDVDERSLFRQMWALGEAMVVDLDMTINCIYDWSPSWFASEFRETDCTLSSNNGLPDRDATVSEFFETFGQQRDISESERIKDWPSTDDFRTFPKLFNDFMNVIPAGFVARRDGVLNLASHAPAATNPPDLGPKGYFSQTSDDSPQGDLADAVNVMFWSSDNPDGTPGTAAWDIYRAQDSALIRKFLFELMAEQSGRPLDQVMAAEDDPIHSQLFFLNSKLRERLLHSKGVKSWRILQRPGQAVFIPAGCAHQVCNLADCIKVASDFVSIENVDRCWTVTQEFREQTKGPDLWRDDVLQLKTQLLWAWLSCQRFSWSVGES
ncbi:hypothetical protein OIV83_001974 [Microbotryomycetes sp. JL201]|nr:hypothetical protein OIV83_001974 [Microbotryomycetes sp. JL201]